MISIYLTRHGRTLFNAAHRGQGWCDSPLLPDGIAVAQALGRGLRAAGVRFDAAFSGDLLRQRNTARLVLDAMGQQSLPVQEDAGFREFCQGSFEGEKEEIRDPQLLALTGAPDILALFGRGLGAFTDALRALDTSGLAERAEDVQVRMEAALHAACRRTQAAGGQTLLIVSSGGSINCLLEPYTSRLGPLENASVSRLTWDDGKITVQSVGEMRFVQMGE